MVYQHLSMNLFCHKGILNLFHLKFILIFYQSTKLKLLLNLQQQINKISLIHYFNHKNNHKIVLDLHTFTF